MKIFPSSPLYTTATDVTDPGPAAGASSSAAAAASTTNTPVYFTPDGKFGENWHSQLGEEFTPHAAQLATFKDVPGLAKSYLHLRAHGPAYPGEGAQPEDIGRFHQLAQVPVEGTPLAYGLALPEGISPAEQGLYDRIAKAAHASHVPGPALKGIVAEYQKIQGEIQQQAQQEQAALQRAGQDTLVAKWGTNFEPNKATARHVITTLAGEAGIPGDDPHLAAILDNPALAQLAVAFSNRTGEGRTRLPNDVSSLRSPRQRAESIMDGTDPTWGKKYTEGTTEEKQAAYQEAVRLLNQK